MGNQTSYPSPGDFGGMNLEQKRIHVQEEATRLFSLDVLDEDSFGRTMERLLAASNETELMELRSALPSIPPLILKTLREGWIQGHKGQFIPEILDAPIQIHNLRNTVARQKGRWFRGVRHRLNLFHSVMVLDLREMASFRDLEIGLYLDCEGSVLSILVPRGARVEERIEQDASTLGIRTGGNQRPDLSLVLEGRAARSAVKVVPRRIWR